MEYEMPMLRHRARFRGLAAPGLILATVIMSGFAFLTAISTYRSSLAAQHAILLNSAFDEARYQVGAEKSLERKYRLEPGTNIRARHHAAAAAVEASLLQARNLAAAEDRRTIDDILAAHKIYLNAVDRIFAAVDAGDGAQAIEIDNREADPALDTIEFSVVAEATERRVVAFQKLRSLAALQTSVLFATPIVFLLSFGLAIFFASVLRSSQIAQQTSQQHLRLMIANISAGVCLFDRERRLVLSNRRYAEMYGLSPDVMRFGMTLPEILSLRATVGAGPVMSTEDYIDWTQRNVSMHTATGRIVRLRDGRTISVRHQPIPDGGYVAMHEDITESMLTEQQTRLQKERAEALLEAVPDPVVIVDHQGRIAVVNARTETTFGYPRAELIGRPVEMLLPEKLGAQHVTLREQFLEKPSAREMGRGRDPHARRSNGSEFPVDVSLSPLATPQETLIISTIRDITERRRTEEQLRQAQKMQAIGNLTGGMAHDFNNLLSVIVLNLELLQEGAASAEDAAELTNGALEAAWRGADLTARLLAFARRQPLRPVRVDINDVVNNTTRMLRRLLGEDIEILLELAADTWPVDIDPAQLEASLTNLATNARDAMQRGGQLLFSTANVRLDAEYAESHAEAAAGDFVLIEVHDTGTGIPPELMDRIFEPFFTTKEPGRGTGLGLSMVFGFLRQSGGHVSVYSEPGRGTTFRLYLPRAMAEGSQTETSSLATVPLGAGETVLVVEDNILMRRIVVRQLQSLGYHVLESDRATAALELLQEQSVQLLLTDIVMPGGLDGIELARIALERWPALKVVLTSGFPQHRVGENGAVLQEWQLLSKPYDKAALAAALRRALDACSPAPAPAPR